MRSLQPWFVWAEGAAAVIGDRRIGARFQFGLGAPHADLERIGGYLRRRAAESRATASDDVASVLVELTRMGSAKSIAARGLDTPVFPIRLTNTSVLFGPIDRAAKPCRGCMETRWRATLPPTLAEAIDAARASELPVAVHPYLTPFLLEMAWCLVSDEVPRALAGTGAGEPLDFHEMELRSATVRRYALLPDPACACALPRSDTPEGARIDLRSRKKPSADRYRMRSADDIALPVRAYVNPVCGALGLTKRRDDAHPYLAVVGGQFTEPGPTPFPLQWSGRAHTYDKSLRIGLLEALERHAGVGPRAKRTSVFETLSALREAGRAALDPTRCGLYEPSTYERTWLTPFSHELRIHWVWGFSLTEGRPILVPSQLAYYGTNHSGDPQFLSSTSSGCAAGSCVEEAILFALLELVERDAFMITWLASLAAPRIDPRSVARRETRLLLERLDHAGLDVHILDSRLDVRLPIASVVAFRRDRELGNMLLSAACHLDPEEAVQGALFELAGFAPGFAERVKSEEAHLLTLRDDPHELTKMDEHSLLYGLPEMADRARFLVSSPTVRSMAETYPGGGEAPFAHHDLREDLEACLAQLAACGLGEVVVVDQTSPEQARLGLVNVCVIVPGLLPVTFGHALRRGFSLPRLQSAPRAAGLRLATTRIEPNPLPHPFP